MSEKTYGEETKAWILRNVKMVDLNVKSHDPREEHLRLKYEPAWRRAIPELFEEIEKLNSELEDVRTIRSRLVNAECGVCKRSLAPDGDCHGCRADKLENKITAVRDLLDSHDGLMAPGDVKIHLVRKELDREN